MFVYESFQCKRGVQYLGFDLDMKADKKKENITLGSALQCNVIQVCLNFNCKHYGHDVKNKKMTFSGLP